jgi:hypothetical protein
MTAVPATGPGTFAALDDSKITRFQYKIMFISGMGFFTDAYDLFIIGIVVALLKPQWHLSTGQVSLLNSATLGASAVGAVIFGRVADILGRKKIYGDEVLILAIGAIASAFSPNYTFLLVPRVILGVGIGGDYPVSEHEHVSVLGRFDRVPGTGWLRRSQARVGQPGMRPARRVPGSGHQAFRGHLKSWLNMGQKVQVIAQCVT